MNPDEPTHSGYLYVPPGGKSLLKKSWQQKFCVLYGASKLGIERLEVYDSTDTKKSVTPARIITLENVIKIMPHSKTHFSVTTRTCAYEFETSDPQSMDVWISALQSVVFPDTSDRCSSIEDNDLYCPSGEGVFTVKLVNSAASLRCALDPCKSYTLVLTPTAVQLYELDHTLLFTWPYCYIRRYGQKGGRFTFEAGRKCESGEGTFFIDHHDQEEIFRCMASKMKSMKKLLKDTSSSNSSSTHLDFHDNHFQAVLNMEPGSRSPLPPSSSSCTTLHEIDSNLSHSTRDKLDKLSLPLHSFTTKSRSKPCKTLSNETFDYYTVERRNDAWRTMGIVDHTESPNFEVDCDPTKSGFVCEKPPSSSSSLSLQSSTLTTSTNANIPPMVLINSSPTTDDYDKLDFFSPFTKLGTPEGYKVVVPFRSVSAPTSPSDDYDEVPSTPSDNIRLKDDYSMGYVSLKNVFSSPDGATTSSIDHQLHNSEPYAIISKPKRV